MNSLSIDLETYSEASLKTGGLYKYVADPAFEILLFGYKLNDEPTKVIDLSWQDVPQWLINALTDSEYMKYAWNFAFERASLNKFFNIKIPLAQCRCRMVHAAMLGLPMSLDQAARVVGLPIGKDQGGTLLLRYFTTPCKPTKANNFRTRNLPEHDPEKWNAFIRYCGIDVDVEHAMGQKIKFFQPPEHEWILWQIDQEINDRGILTDPVMIEAVMNIDVDNRFRCMKEAREITKLANPNSRNQLLSWLQDEMPLEEIDTLRAEDLPVLHEAATGYINESEIQRMIMLRKELSKTSIKKYQAIVNCRGDDNRCRGLFQFYGANRTGRFAGRLLQFHNQPKTLLKDLDRARRTACSGDVEVMDMLMPFIDDDGEPVNLIPTVLSQLIRTAFVPKPGHKFVVVDSSQIEARICSWLANEEWRMEVFRTHGMIYEASAAAMFEKKIEDVTKEDRARAKVAELALGYQGGKKAMQRMDTKKKVRALALKKFETQKDAFRIEMDLKRTKEKKPLYKDPELMEKFVMNEYQAIVSKWRPANPAIKHLWYQLNTAAIACVRERRTVTVDFITMFMQKGTLFIKLPSGRCLSYLQPEVRVKVIKQEDEDPFEVECVAYKGVDQEKKTWGIEYTYGGKLTENICQAIARDCLGHWMMQISKKYIPCAHVHDEIILEVPEDIADEVLKECVNTMSQPIPWAPGLPLAAAGFTNSYYKKD